MAGSLAQLSCLGLCLALVTCRASSPLLAPPMPAPASTWLVNMPPPTGPAFVFESTNTPATPPILPPLPELAVEEFGPKGLVDVGAEPQVRFNQQVAAVGEDLLTKPSLRIDLVPKVAGRSRFRTPELLVFEPKALKLAQRYRACITVLPSAKEALKALLGSHPLSWDFETPGPAVTEAYPDNGDKPDRWSRRHPVLLKLTQPVTTAALRKVLSARSIGSDTRPIAVLVDPVSPAEARRWDWASYLLTDDEPLRDRLFQVRPVDGWPVDHQIAVEVAAGLVGRLGPVPSAAPWQLTWKTPGPLRIESVTTDNAFCANTAIVVHFSAQIAASQLSRIRISPRPANTKVTFDDYSDDSDQPGTRAGAEVRFRGAFVPGRTYTIQIDPSLRDVDGYTVGDGTSGKPWNAPISVAGEPSLQLSREGVFPSITSPLFGVTTRLVKVLRLRAAILDLEQTRRVQFGSKDLKSADIFEQLEIASQNIVVRDYPLDVQAPTYWSDKAFDLRDLVGDVRGTVLVEVAPLVLVERPANAPAMEPLAAQHAVYRRTDLGPITFHSITKSVVKVARLSDGRPVAKAKVARLDGDRQVLLGHTDNQGLLVLPWMAGQLPTDGQILAVSEESTHDRVLVRLAAAYEDRKHDTQATLLQRGEHLLLQLTTERDAYRPEESIALVGFALVDTPFTRSGLRLLPPGTPIAVRVTDREQKITAEQSLPLSAEGKFWARLPIRAGTPLGGLTVTAEAQGATTRAYVKLEDFRVPEFEVIARAANDSLLIGDSTTVRVRASHYSGVPVTIEDVAYASTCRPSLYVVPGLGSGWVAGGATHKPKAYRSTHSVRQTVSNARGARGSVEFTPSLDPGDETSLLCSLAVEVKDASQQAIGAETSVRIHPASLYLALRPPVDLHAGDDASIPLHALSIDGQRRAANDVKLNVTRNWMEEVHQMVDGRLRTRWQERHDTVAKCRLDAKLDRDAICSIGQVKEGQYTIEASARDESRNAITTAGFAVWRKPAQSSPGIDDEIDDAIPQHLHVQLRRTDAGESPKREFAPGDHLQATLHSPCANGSAIALLERAGIREQHALALNNHTAALDLLVDDTWIPQIDLAVQTLCKSEAGYPMIENDYRRITVSSAGRELRVAVSVPARATPGQALPIAVEVHDADGRPVRRGHVALWAVDEAVLSLGEHRVNNPLPRFLPERGAETSMSHDYGALLHAYVPTEKDPLLDPEACDAYGSGGLGLSGFGEGGGGRGEGIGVGASKPARARFETTPIFIGEQQLDERGRAQLEGRLPDSLTTFRITAIASAPLANDTTTGRFGVGESNVQVSAQFIVRPSLPRQMRPGDTAEIAAILQNQTSSEGKVTLTASTDGPAAALTFLDDTTLERPLGAGEQLRVPLHVRAERVGVAEVELRARFVPAEGESLSDAVRIPLPIVMEPTLVERTAHYGTLDSSAAVAVAVGAPASVVPSVGGLSLSLSSSLAGELQDAFKYLLDYPYGCIEQTSSRVLALVAARELAQRFGIDGAEASRRLALGIERIASMQTSSGGFAYWPEGKTPHPYATGFATRVLWLAKQSGAPVPTAVLERALEYLDGWAKNGGIARGEDSSGWLRSGLFPSERAMALAVLADAGRNLPMAALDEALANRSDLPNFARTLLLSALARAKPDDPRLSTLLEELLASVSELPAAAHVREGQESRWEYLFHSPSRSDAMALHAMLQLRPGHALVPKLARGLMDVRVGGRWRNTQENAYALLSMLEYIRRFEAERPDFTARAWIGNRPFLDTRLTPATPTMSAFFPTAQLLAQPQPLSVVLQREGKGRLYFRLGTEWQQAVAEAPARDQGLTIERSVRLRSGSASASVPVGEAVAFDLVIKSRSPLSYVAIEVPIPAGLSPVLDNLGKGHIVSRLDGAKLADHEERHPDRVLLFVNRLPAGEHHHTVQLRAVTPGEFALPPARAEAMYMPEIYGRTAGGRLTVTR
jgi:alpha-2-macroglobulin